MKRLILILPFLLVAIAPLAALDGKEPAKPFMFTGGDRSAAAPISDNLFESLGHGMMSGLDFAECQSVVKDAAIEDLAKFDDIPLATLDPYWSFFRNYRHKFTHMMLKNSELLILIYNFLTLDAAWHKMDKSAVANNDKIRLIKGSYTHGGGKTIAIMTQQREILGLEGGRLLKLEDADIARLLHREAIAIENATAGIGDNEGSGK